MKNRKTKQQHQPNPPTKHFGAQGQPLSAIVFKVYAGQHEKFLVRQDDIHFRGENFSVIKIHDPDDGSGHIILDENCRTIFEQFLADPLPFAEVDVSEQHSLHADASKIIDSFLASYTTGAFDKEDIKRH